MIKIGCSGWPVGQQRYYQEFSTIEISSSLYNLPNISTAEGWRRAAPRDFEFAVKCWQLVTHPASSTSYGKLSGAKSPKALAQCGHFRQSAEVDAAWESTRTIARALKAKFIVFETPSTFYPNANHLRDIYGFFKKIRRDPGVHYVWEPQGGGWGPALVQKVCRALSLVHGVDPMIDQPAHGSVHYFRLRGAYEAGRLNYACAYSDSRLRNIVDRCQGKASYVYFANNPMYADARRLSALLNPLAARSPSVPGSYRTLH